MVENFLMLGQIFCGIALVFSIGMSLHHRRERKKLEKEYFELTGEQLPRIKF